jgi:hypothetical protein
MNENGADTTTFSDGNLILMLLFYPTKKDTLRNKRYAKYAIFFKKLMPLAFL